MFEFVLHHYLCLHSDIHTTVSAFCHLYIYVGKVKVVNVACIEWTFSIYVYILHTYFWN